MTKLSYVALFFLIPTVVFSQDTIKRNKYLITSSSCLTTIRQDGREVPYTGYAYYTYLLGRWKRLVPYKLGVIDGTVTEYYKNGKKKSEGEFKNGDPYGKTIYYYSTGEKMEEQYLDNTGTGKYTDYYKNGQIGEEGQILNGQKNGTFLTYNEYDGALVYKYSYVNGKQISKIPISNVKVLFLLKIDDQDSTGLVTILKNDKPYEIINSSGRSRGLALDLNSLYLFKFTKPGYVTKSISIDTNVPIENLTDEFDRIHFTVKLYKDEGKIRPLEKQLVGEIKFNKEIKDFEYIK
jgi:antitoxin component YwqK of YwqJK toxin-antitoxin module